MAFYTRKRAWIYFDPVSGETHKVWKAFATSMSQNYKMSLQANGRLHE